MSDLPTPKVTFNLNFVELHFLPPGADRTSAKTRALRLARDSSKGEFDENVRFIRAIAAGPQTATALQHSLGALEVAKPDMDFVIPDASSTLCVNNQIPLALKALREAVPTYKKKPDAKQPSRMVSRGY